eukprot:14132-Heterococcus_DN1.PRE.2
MLRLLQQIRSNVQRLRATDFCLRCTATSTHQVSARLAQVVSTMHCYDNYDQLRCFKLDLARTLQNVLLVLSCKHSLLHCRNANSAFRTAELRIVSYSSIAVLRATLALGLCKNAAGRAILLCCASCDHTSQLEEH